MTDIDAAVRCVQQHANGPDDAQLLLDMLGITPAEPRRRPGRPAVDHGHGHPDTYSKGCRCDQCRAANAARCLERRKRAAKDPERADRAGHGKAGTYNNHGCRCEPCKAAHSERMRPYIAARRARKKAVA